jgi:hypothetical protein
MKGIGEVDIRVPKEFQSSFLNIIGSNNISSSIYIEDVQALIDIETQQFNNRTVYTGTGSKKEEDDFFRS